MIASKLAGLFEQVPDEFDRLADHRADDVVGVVIAIRAGKLHHAEFHQVPPAGILAHAEGDPAAVAPVPRRPSHPANPSYRDIAAIAS